MAKHAVKTKKLSTKGLIALIAAVVMLTGMIGGTVAWLVAKTESVVNTFTYGDINIKLEETDTNDGDNNANTNEYKMVPGQTITKDPVISVLKGSEDCYLFVKLDKSTDANFDDFMIYEMADGWTALDNVAGVYYREVAAADVADADKTFGVIKDNTVSVKETVTKQMLNDLTDATYPTLTVTGYAVQKAGFDSAAAAWAVTQ
ncbi:MAG: hypothetical protein J6R33_02365 [Clostridia bacterium]|nr:hypothetical protein [Clostridia bacterium]